MDYESEDIEIGRLIHEKSYARERKNINLGEVSFDFVKKRFVSRSSLTHSYLFLMSFRPTEKNKGVDGADLHRTSVTACDSSFSLLRAW